MSSAVANMNDPTPQETAPRFGRGTFGAIVLLSVVLPCILTLPWSIREYDRQRLTGDNAAPLRSPELSYPMGTDLLGRSLLWRCMLGGAISLGIGIGAAAVAVTIGVSWGAIAGYAGGRVDAVMMRTVDVLYGLPYVLLVVLVNLAARPVMERALSWMGGAIFKGTSVVSSVSAIADVATLLLAIGSVSWLTMARVIRGQVLSLRGQGFVEAARGYGAGPWRIVTRHLLPNLVGPIVVYATLSVPSAILQESFLSYLGIGVQAPLPSWGSLAAQGLEELHALGLEGGAANLKWWLPLWPCVLLAAALLSLNLLGEALRERLDPRSMR
jgi:oligopeptide transport system permease protein